MMMQARAGWYFIRLLCVRGARLLWVVSGLLCVGKLRSSSHSVFCPLLSVCVERLRFVAEKNLEFKFEKHLRGQELFPVSSKVF